MPGASEDIVAIQVASEKPDIHKGLSSSEVASLIGKRASYFPDRLSVITKRLEAIQKEVVPNPDKVVEYFNVQMAQAQTDVIVNRDLDQIEQKEQVARIDALHRYTSVGSCILCDSTGYGGSSRFIGATWPNLSWWPYNFNDRTSSVVAWGFNMLFENSWYGGRRLLLVGLPYIAIPDLSTLGFNNIASSYTSF